MDISSVDMTARLEKHMDAIMEGSLTRAEVVAESQKMLEQAWKSLDAHIDAIRDSIKTGAKEDRGEGLILGVCSNCGGQLKVLRGRTGKRFVACVGKEGAPPPSGEGPDGKPLRPGCGQTFPLPQRGVIMPTGTTCTSCGWPEIKVTGAGNRGRPWTLCLDMDCPTKEQYRQRKQQRQSS